MLEEILYRNSLIKYAKVGAGKPVFLIHGFCEDHTMFDGIIDSLASTCTIICPDLPGFGGSALSEETLTIDWMAALMNAILEKENFSSATLIGHSLGGYIAIHFAALYPEKTAALGFINSHVFDDGDERKQNREKSIDFIKKHTARLFIRELINNLFSEEYKKEHTEVVIALIKNAQETISDVAVIAALEAMRNREDKSETLERFTKPLLFIIGKKDTTIPLAQSLSQVSLPAQSDIHIRCEAAHMSVYEDKEYTQNCLLNFLNR
jgi:pimeloyl-ACP methyl ester carboxylesterase